MGDQNGRNRGGGIERVRYWKLVESGVDVDRRLVPTGGRSRVQLSGRTSVRGALYIVVPMLSTKGCEPNATARCKNNYITICEYRVTTRCRCRNKLCARTMLKRGASPRTNDGTSAK